MLKTLRFILPSLVLICLIAFWFMPHYSEDDEGYYRAVFCVINHDEPRAFLHDMQNIVEGGNSDYALHKNHYIPALGEKMFATWQQLSLQEKGAVSADQQQCRDIMSQKQH